MSISQSKTKTVGNNVPEDTILLDCYFYWTVNRVRRQCQVTIPKKPQGGCSHHTISANEDKIHGHGTFGPRPVKEREKAFQAGNGQALGNVVG